jgi:hypothetical protein
VHNPDSSQNHKNGAAAVCDSPVSFFRHASEKSFFAARLHFSVALWRETVYNEKM